MNYYRRFPADYANDTRHLNFTEHGAYTLLLDWCYANQRSLPRKREDIYRKMCARSEDERKAIDTILTDFFDRSKTGFTHRRVQKEINHMERISAQASVNGKKGIEIRLAKAKRNLSEGSASQKLEARSYKLEPEKVKTVAQQIPLSESRFEVFWESYPRKVGKPAARKAWNSIVGIENHSGKVLAGLSRWIPTWTDPQFIPHPATFLNQRRWEDEARPKVRDDSAERIAVTFRH